MFIDVHTHKQSTEEGVVSLPSYYQLAEVDSKRWCTAGIHPWYVEGNDWALLEQVVLQPNVLAIGECGLDKVCKTDWALQLQTFEYQVRLSKRIGKPLIIHCVRAFEETMQVLIRNKVNVPVIFHGYRNNLHIARRLITQGYYLSFGAAILPPDAQAAKVLADMPANQWFMETDDAEVSIQQIYQRAGEVRNIGHENVILQLEQNFKTVFNK